MCLLVDAALGAFLWCVLLQYLRSLARDVISQHPVIDMWEKREAVGREMLAAFDEFLSNV